MLVGDLDVEFVAPVIVTREDVKDLAAAVLRKGEVLFRKELTTLRQGDHVIADRRQRLARVAVLGAHFLECFGDRPDRVRLSGTWNLPLLK